MTVKGPREVTLLDLSQSGARLQLTGPERVTGGILKWMDFEVFGVRVWQDGQTVGLQFEKPISSSWVLATRNWRPSTLEAKVESRSFARDWAKGAGDRSLDPLLNRSKSASSQAGPSLDMQRLRQSNKSRWSRSSMVFILGSSVIGILVGIGSCYF
ncbi:MAG: hypothetical protein J7493_14055 [Porphyrobacter sp.]|nr:hypothetical protein [Porphyrobacter sp.]